MTQTKNPLYVVKDDGKGKVIEEARGVVDMIIKKFNLGPLFEMLNQLIMALLASVENYPTFKAIKESIDVWLDQIVGYLDTMKKA